MEIVISPCVAATREQVLGSGAFRHWAAKHGTEQPGTITIIDADVHEGTVGMIYMMVEVEGEPWPVKHILRSPTVDVLTIVTDGKDDGWAVFVRQYRRAVGDTVISNVAGGRGWDEDPKAAALRELKEELGFQEIVERDGKLWLSETVTVSMERLLQKPVLASPGITNEAVDMFRATITVPANEVEAFLDGLEGKRTGVAEEGEAITVYFVPVAHVVRHFLYHTDGGECVDGKLIDSLGLAGLL